MAFCCKVNDSVEAIFFEQAFNLWSIGNIGFFENIVRCVLDILQVLEIACISKGIKVYDPIVGIFIKRTTCEPINPAPPVMSNVFFMLRMYLICYWRRLLKTS